ncbi:MAG: hypothetical protein MJ215_01195 [Spirochaetia bacterium]|nr:hypothetical protein [Spirochaetia bacterium]
MKKSILFLILAAAAMVLMLSSCSAESDDETCTIEKRIKSFFDDINNDKSVAYENLHPGCTMRNDLKDPRTWNESPFSGSDYTYKGNKFGSAWIGTFSGGIYLGDNIEFRLKEDGTDNWKILSISINGEKKIY